MSRFHSVEPCPCAQHDCFAASCQSETGCVRVPAFKKTRAFVLLTFIVGGFVVRFFRILLATTALFIAATLNAMADAPKLALVITNKAYPDAIGALENTHRDGERIAASLTALGFAVSHRRDLDKGGMVTAIADYVDRLRKAGPEAVGFFYYAGHGAANSKYGDNYLIPIQAPIISDSQLALQAVKLGEVINSIAATSAKTNFLVFDACRNVPMSFSVRSATHGLRPEGHRQGMLIAFATDPGKTATDEGVYAEALTEEMQKPGVLATEVFRAVRSRVLAATENRQFPWIEDGLIDNMYFKPPSAPASQQTAAAEASAGKPGDPVAGSALARTVGAADKTLSLTLGASADDPKIAALGVQMQTWDKSWNSAFKADWQGAFIMRMNDGAAAQAGGIRAFDLIIAFDGEPIDSGPRLSTAVRLKKPGRAVEVRLRRLSEEKSVVVEHLKKGAEANDLGAIKLLAAIDRAAFGSPQAQREAFALLKKAAELGDANSSPVSASCLTTERASRKMPPRRLNFTVWLRTSAAPAPRRVSAFFTRKGKASRKT